MNNGRRATMATATQLGDITFEDWYDNPVFDQEPDERWEELATSGRRPVRMIAGAVLRVVPDRTPAAPPHPMGDGQVHAPVLGWRERTGRLLDRWAETEAAWQERLEDIVLPRRWRP